MPRARLRLPLLLLLAGFAAPSSSASAQSLLDRPPNLSGAWTGAPGTLYFHFLHRFSSSAAPERKVTSVPTFLVAAGLPRRLLVGLDYSTNSTLAPRFPNEYELFGRWAPLAQDYGAPLDVGVQVGYNNAADGVDGELSAARRVGPGRVIVAARTLSDPFDGGGRRYAVAGGAVVRLGTYVSLAGDVAALTERDPAEKVAWSAGLHLAIPMSPHTLSLQATNTLVTTLQGASRGTDQVRYGFEFTIPLTLRRYFGRRARPVAAAGAASTGEDTATAAAPAGARDTNAAASPPSVPAIARAADSASRADTAATPPSAATSAAAPTTARARAPDATRRTAAAKPARNGMKNVGYLQPRAQVTVGTTMEWTNGDPLPHTVTATDGSFDSGLIQPGKTYRHTFTKAGTYHYFCTPHPFMTGVVVVKAP